MATLDKDNNTLSTIIDLQLIGRYFLSLFVVMQNFAFVTFACSLLQSIFFDVRINLSPFLTLTGPSLNLPNLIFGP